MSVTFFCPEAPITNKRIPCDMSYCEEGNRCGYCEDGFEVVRESEAPEINFANTNARDILALIGLEGFGLYGVLDTKGVQVTRKFIFAAMNLPNLRKDLVRESVLTLRTGQKCSEAEYQSLLALDIEDDDDIPVRVYEGGNTDERTLERLASLDALFAYAEGHNYTVSWG